MAEASKTEPRWENGNVRLAEARRPARAKTWVNLQDKNRLFWILQTSGWLLFLAVNLLFFQVRGNLTTSLFVRYATASAAGFGSTLLLRLIYRRIRIRDRSVVFLSLTTILFSLLGANLVIWVSDLLRLPYSGPDALRENLALMAYGRRVLWWLIPIVGWSVLYCGIQFWQEWMVQKDRAEKARALTQTAQLHMLRYRLNPHFLFNALNSIRALITEDKASARRMVSELADYLRYSLVSKNYASVPFRDEIESVRHYFNIQKMRYEQKLDVAFDIDPAAEEYPIASFLLNPLVENAVKYGMQTSTLPLKIQIKVRVPQGRLEIDVINSGSWVEPASRAGDRVAGQGLDNVRRRLADAYPEKHSMDIFEKDGLVHARLIIEQDVRR